MKTDAIVYMQESARRLQAQSGHLMHHLKQPTIDLAAVVRILGTIEDTAHETIEVFHDYAKDTPP